MEKILIVDDEESIRMLYADELIEEGYEVITIGEGSRVMELIKNEGPDLVLLDIRLGEHNGLDILQDIRNTYYDMPVILCTAYPTYKIDLRSIAADDYVVKSSSLEELKFSVRRALEARIQPSSPSPYNVAPMDQMGIL